MTTKIEWAGETWNPTTGCDRISPGCDHCYALTMAKRLKGMGQEKYQNDGDPRTSGPGFGLTVHPSALAIPLHRKAPQTWFVNSMSDLFHARVPVPFIAEVWGVMARTPQHTYQILTKRSHRMSSILLGLDVCFEPLPNVWLGTSIELDKYACRADGLRETPAAVRFLSLEPLLGPLPSLDLSGIDWAIIGGGSGPDAREMDLGWARDLLAQCRDAGVAPFVKQLGSVWARDNGGGKGGDWERWPADLMVREFPAAAEVISA